MGQNQKEEVCKAVRSPGEQRFCLRSQSGDPVTKTEIQEWWCGSVENYLPRLRQSTLPALPAGAHMFSV